MSTGPEQAGLPGCEVRPDCTDCQERRADCEYGLFIAAEQGDRRARNELLARALDVIDACVRRSVPEGDADDVIHDAAERALGRWGQFRLAGSLRAWLRAIARRTVADYYCRSRRDRALSVPLETARATEDAGAQEALEAAETRLAVARELSPASERQRQALRLRYGDDQTNEEVGEAIGVSASAAHMLIRRALGKIRKEARSVSGLNSVY